MNVKGKVGSTKRAMMQLHSVRSVEQKMQAATAERAKRELELPFFIPNFIFSKPGLRVSLPDRDKSGNRQ